MCSGRVDLAFVLRAFANGMDGVLIGGCRLNECNYITHGNYDALNMTLLCKQIMANIGLDPARLRIAFMSSGEGHLFTQAVDDFTATIKALGPLGRAEALDPQTLTSRLARVQKLVPYIKLEQREKLAARLGDPADHATLFSSQEIDTLLNQPVSYVIEPDKCRACMICLRRCPAEAINGAKKQVHVIDQDKCIKCGTCLEACPPRFGAVTRIDEGPVPPPLPEARRAVKERARTKSTP